MNIGSPAEGSRMFSIPFPMVEDPEEEWLPGKKH